MPVEPVPEAFAGYLIPYLVVEGAAEAIDFYVAAFGAVEVNRTSLPDDRVLNAQMMLGPQPFWVMEDMIDVDGGEPCNPLALGNTPVALHRFVPDVDAAVSQAIDAGARLLLEPTDMPWGHRYAAVIDPHGHEWTFASVIEELTDDELTRRFGG